jgi:hypothetical protein
MQIAISKLQFVKGGFRLEDYELANKLRNMYDRAKRNEAVCQINLFGIIYAKDIQDGGYSLKHIVELSGISKGYLTEVSKGIKLSKYVMLKDLEE